MTCVLVVVILVIPVSELSVVRGGGRLGECPPFVATAPRFRNRMHPAPQGGAMAFFSPDKSGVEEEEVAIGILGGLGGLGMNGAIEMIAGRTERCE